MTLVRPDHTGRGHGRLLYDALLATLDEEGVHLCVAAIGFKHGRWVDVAWWQRVTP